MEDLALALQASLIVRHSDPVAGEAFCATRLAERPHKSFGTLPAGAAGARIVERALAI